MNDVSNQFREAIREAGLSPPDYFEYGRIQRFPGKGKSNNNKAGWCMLFDDGLAGCFGDWSTGFSRIWHANNFTPLSQPEASSIIKVKAARLRAEKRIILLQTEAAKRAASILDSSIPSSHNHPYLIRKQIMPFGIKEYKEALVLPLQDFSGNLTSLQFIDMDGNKRLLKGGRKKGSFVHVAGSADEPELVIICEGWATGCTLASENNGALVLAAIDAGNLDVVAIDARDKWPFTELLVAGDDDRLVPGNPGATKARIAASLSSARLTLPNWPEDAPDTLTDFNDLACWLNRGSL